MKDIQKDLEILREHLENDNSQAPEGVKAYVDIVSLRIAQHQKTMDLLTKEPKELLQ